jgi:hypothetical protein
VLQFGVHTLLKYIFCYLAHIIGLRVHILHIQIYFCKAKHTITCCVEEMPLLLSKVNSLTSFLSLNLVEEYLLLAYDAV